MKKALKQDYGRGIIRIDPEVFNSFEFRSGDILLISHFITKKQSVGILFPSRPEDRGTNSIRLDAFMLRNLQAKLGDEVAFSKVEPVLAEQVLFSTSDIEITSKYTYFLAKKFQNRIINIGDLLSFYYYGRRIDLEVLEYIPQGEVAKIHEKTAICFQEK